MVPQTNGCVALLAFVLLALSSLSLKAQDQEQRVKELLESGSAKGAETALDAQKSRDIRPQDVIHWAPQLAEVNPQAGELLLVLGLTTERDFTIYVENLKWGPPAGWSIRSVSSPPKSRQFDPISRQDVDVFTGGTFKVLLQGPKGETPKTVDLMVEYVGCTRVICLFPHNVSLSFAVIPNAKSLGAPPTSVGDVNATAATTPGESNDASSPNSSSGTLEEEFAKKVKAGTMTFGMLLLIAFVGGLLTNLTPCVAPMIPITIRLLSNQGARPIFGSSMYALGIVVTYTVLGVIAAMSGALFGNLIAHPAVSITFGIVMALLGLSMLGFGDLSKLQQFGGRIGSSQGGPFNAFLMGTGAGLVASPCTGPILAALLTYTAGKSSVSEATALLGIYSLGFALPYVFLGASAAKISKMRVNYRVQVATKLVFAAVMFGLSLYFLRIPLYGLFTSLKPYWGSIGLIGSILGLGLTGYMIVKAGLEQNKFFMIIPAASLGCGLFFGIQSLTRSSESTHNTLTWYKTEATAFAESEKTGKPILVDAWAEWCEACKKMDVTTFADPAVIEELGSNWIVFKMDLTESNDQNDALQERYELPGLPTLTLLPSGGNLDKKRALNGYVSATTLLQELTSFRKKKN